MDLCEDMMIMADGKNLSAVLCGENGEMSTQQNQLRSDGLCAMQKERYEGIDGLKAYAIRRFCYMFHLPLFFFLRRISVSENWPA